MFENLVEILKANPRKIVYTEGSDARILESAARLKKDGFLTPVLVGNVEEVKAAAAKGGFDRALNVERAQTKLKALGHDTKSVDAIMSNALASVKGTAFGMGDAASAAAGLINL